MRLALDLDGTLVDARARQVAVASHVLGEMGEAALEEDLFWALKRAGATTERALVKLGYPLRAAADIADSWRKEIEADRWLELDDALPGVLRVLQELRSRGVTITVLTARQRAEGAARSLEGAGLADLVDELHVVDPARAVAAKADLLARHVHVGFVGDTASDGEAAAAAGVPFVAVTSGQCCFGHLYSLGYRVVPTLREAVGLFVGRSPAGATVGV
jgi:phosphoglycolate phosphatase